MGRIGIAELGIISIIALIIPVAVCIACYRLGIQRGKRLGFQQASGKSA